MRSAPQTKTEQSFIVVGLIATDEDKKCSPAGLMAEAIIEIIKEQGGCLSQDLHARGFTFDETATHWHMAQSLAAVELKLMGNKSGD